MGSARAGRCRRLGRLGKAAVVATSLLLGPCIGVPAAAQTDGQDQGAKPASRKAKASKGDRAQKRDESAGSHTPHSPKAADKALAKQVAKLDPAKIDLLQLSVAEAMQVATGKLDPKSPNSWVVLGLMEGAGGNLGGAKESLERAIALGERRNKAAAAAAAILLGKVHLVRLGLVRMDASFADRPSKDTRDFLARELESAKVLLEKGVTLYKTVGNKDGMAAGYEQLGRLYSTTTDYDEAQTAIGKALAINKALQRKKAMAANYRALADTHRYDLDQAEVLLKEAIALHEALGLKEELAKDYEKLGAINKYRGEPYEAERFYKQALALTPRPNQVSLLRALAHLYTDRDDPGQAAEMKELAGAIEKERSTGSLIVLNPSLGLYLSGYAARQQTEALEKAVPMEKKLRHWVGLANSYTLLGMHYAERAKLDEGKRAELEGRAAAMLREAIVLNGTLGHEPAMAHAYDWLAKTADARGNLAEVEETLKDSLALRKKMGKEADMARLYLSLGHLRSTRGDEAQACDYWRKGATAYPDARDLVDALNRRKCAATP